VAGWNFAELWESVADALPDAPALMHGERLVTWAEMDTRADGVAQWLLELGVQEQDKVAQYLYNGTEYMESVFAAFKAGLAPVNTNYRYHDDELLYLWDNADAVAVIFGASFTDRVAKLRDQLPKVKGWLWVDDGSGPLCPEWATSYDEVAATGPGRQRGPWGRDGDHLLMLYTGGTTGMPKGVMWRQDDLLMMMSQQFPQPFAEEPDYDAFRTARVAPGPVAMPACPLMHGTGCFVALIAMTQGGSVVTLTGRSFDAVELLAAIEWRKVNLIAIVGDAFAKPILRALDADPGRWDLSSLLAIMSSGVMWSEETKRGLLGHHSAMVLMDVFSSSEALGMGTSVSGGGLAAETATFQLGPNAAVITEDGRIVEPGSGEIGLVGVAGRGPVGYYKDEEKSARTFRVIGGQRYSIPGDFATVEADGSIRLLGRGSVCINTGGEKVFPEEVEEAVKTFPGVRDAVVVGVPDDVWGEAITALVEADADAEVDDAALVAYVKERLAPYKAPKAVLFVDTVGRAPNGKVDYRACREQAMARLA
jgi:3-oxocholest-4-en-26-oate---CoA ligase